MSLHNAMETLSMQLLGAYQARKEAVVDIRVTAAQHLTTFRKEHQERSAEQRRKMRQQIEALRHDSTELINHLKATRQTMSHQQSQDLQQLAENVRNETAELLKHLHDVHQAMSHEQEKKTYSIL